MDASVDGLALLRGALKAVPEWRSLRRGLTFLALLEAGRLNSIGALLERQARQFPQRPALLFQDRSWTYAEFNVWANRLAHTLKARGVRAGDAVGVLLSNRPEALALVAATVKLGAIAAMLNPQQAGELLVHSLRVTAARWLVVGEECWTLLAASGEAEAFARRGALFWEGEGPAPPDAYALRAAAARAPEHDPAETAQVLMHMPAFYIFTSGTTGWPKASIMSHDRWLRGMVGLGLLSLRLEATDVLYCCLPLHHNNALTVSWGAAMGSGAALALSPKFSASRFWEELGACGATAFCYIGELCRYLLNRPPSPSDRRHQVRVITGNGLRPELWRAFQSRFGIDRICEFYGASESNVAFVNALDAHETAGFSPLRFAIVALDPEREEPIRDARGFLRRVRKGEVGLLISPVTRRRPFEGYTDRSASEAKLLRNVFRRGDCWFNSGDLVRAQGFRHIQFVDRVGDSFRWKGENVASTVVEAVLNRHPRVEHAVVYGVQVPHAEGRAGMASLTWRDGTFDGAGLARYLREQLPPYAVPVLLRLRAQQEVTPTFKYRKQMLRREGFDPEQVREPLYLLCAGAPAYRPLTPALLAALQRGELRF